ncbi:MAG: hypothetical protein OXU20_36645, partial [Myxococcales bacterium]|nr:hypothetical protein [Myxococcales bacterium]
MTRPDSLQQAVLALRGEDGSTEDPTLSERLIVQRLRKRHDRSQRTRALAMWVVGPLAATAACMAVYVEYGDGRPREPQAYAPRPAAADSEAPPNAGQQQPASRPEPVRVAFSRPVVEPVPGGATPEPLPAPPRRREKARPKARAATKQAPVARTSSAKRSMVRGQGLPSTNLEAGELYARAHSLHFAKRAPHRALRAWDRYLHAAPDHALAPEARYNRALCLVRLRRHREAIAAL